MDTLRWTLEDPPPADDAQYSSRLRAVWLVGVPREDRWDADTHGDTHGHHHGGTDDTAGDLVEVTPAFAWVS